MSINIHLSSEIEAIVRRAWGDTLDRALLEALAIEGYRSGLFGSATVGRLLDHESRWETERWLAERGVVTNYTVDDLDADRAALDRLLGESH